MGDTLSRHALGDSVRPRLVQAFPPAEVAAHDAAAQAQDRLEGLAAPFLWPQGVVLVLGALGLLAFWRALARRGGPLPEAERRLRRPSCWCCWSPSRAMRWPPARSPSRTTATRRASPG
ncbi:hypothetical protein [Teichococcus aestuarii]|uniref:hypothetical protein n=1 Tax=Teichococcus aestuarii TaxID=568898 RepID=UPI00361BEB15